MLFVTELYAPDRKHDPKEDLQKWLSQSRMTLEKLKLALEINCVTSPEIVLAQSRLETGNYKSKLCLVYNNLFGMNYPRIRPTTSVGSTEYGFAIYRSWYDCVKDMKLFQDYYRNRGKDLSNYLEFLTSVGYAEDPDYLNKLTLLCLI